MTGYVLIITIITSYGATSTQHIRGFNSYEDCVQHAVAAAETQPVNPGDRIKWDCERE